MKKILFILLILCSTGFSQCEGLVVSMSDSWGDGWNGNILTIGSESFTLNSGPIDEDCYTGEMNVPVTCGGGIYPSEVFWSILDYNNNVLLSGGAPFEGFLDDSLESPIYNEEYINDLILDKMELGIIPGLAASVIKNGEVIWTGTYGYANIEEGISVTENTNFMLASISKTVTATAMMQLYEDGLIRLFDPINQSLNFSVENPYYNEIDITNYMLLTHTNAIADNWNIMDGLSFGGGPTLELDYFLYNYLSPDGEYYNNSNFLYSEPGTYWHYSNVGFAINALIIENITGESFDEYCNQNIFGPLDMENTSWHLTGMDIDNIAIPYGWSNGEFTPLGNYWVPDYPSGQLRSNINELSNYLISYMQGGVYNSNNILDSSTIDYMLTEHVDDGWAGMSNGWGLGWYYKIQNGRTLWGHNGWMFGVATEMFYEPEQDIGVIILINGDGASVYNQIINIEIALLNFAEQYNMLMGDVNNDSALNVLDVIAMVSHILGNSNLIDEQVSCADINYDNALDILDVVAVVAIILGN